MSYNLRSRNNSIVLDTYILESDQESNHSGYSSDSNMDNNFLPKEITTIDSTNASEVITVSLSHLKYHNLESCLSEDWYKIVVGVAITNADLLTLRNAIFPNYTDAALTDAQKKENKKDNLHNNKILQNVHTSVFNLLPKVNRDALLATLLVPFPMPCAISISQLLSYIKETFLEDTTRNEQSDEQYASTGFSSLKSQETATAEIETQKNLLNRLRISNPTLSEAALQQKSIEIIKRKLQLSPTTFLDKVNEFRAGRITYDAYYESIFAAYNYFRYHSSTPLTPTQSANAAYGRQREVVGRQREVTADEVRDFMYEHRNFMRKYSLNLYRTAPSTEFRTYCPAHGYCNHGPLQCFILPQFFPTDFIKTIDNNMYKKPRKDINTRGRGRSRSRSRSASRTPRTSRSPGTRHRANSVSDASAYSVNDLIDGLGFDDTALQAYVDDDFSDNDDVNNKLSAYSSSSSSHTSEAAIDTGATKTFTPSPKFISNKTSAPRLIVRTAGSESFASTTQGTLAVALPNVNARIVPGLEKTLLSVSDYCKRNNASFVFDKHNCRVTSKSVPLSPTDILLTAPLNPATGLYTTPLGKLPTSNNSELNLQPAYANAIYFHHGIHHQNDFELVSFYHKMFGCPPASTFLKAISQLDDLQCFPGLTTDKIRKNLPHDPITSTGHMKRIRQGLGSTKRFVIPNYPPTNNRLYAVTISIKDTDELTSLFSSIKYHNKSLYADLTGRMPVTSYDGYEYICVFYHPGRNYIHLEPMKTRTGKEYRDTFSKALSFYEAKLTIVSRFITDNETSKEVTDFFDSKNLAYQFVPPQNHRANQAERAIDTVKSHIISTINATDRSFDLKLWPALLPQIEITLNWMRVSTTNPRLSAYASLFGPYNYNKHPMVPLGTKVMVYTSKSERVTTSWGDKSKEGFYVGPSLNHYRCYRIYLPETKKFIPSDTVIFYPERYIMPGGNSIELLDKSITYLTDVLNEISLPPNGSPDKAAISKKILDGFQEMRNLFQYPQYPHNVPKQPVQSLPSTDDLTQIPVGSEDDTIPRVIANPDIVPRVSAPNIPTPLQPDRTTSLSRLPKRSKPDTPTPMQPDRTTLSRLPKKPKSNAKLPPSPPAPDVDTVLNEYIANRKVVNRNILKTSKALQRFNVTFTPSLVSEEIILPPLEDSPADNDTPNEPPPEQTYERAQLITTDPLLKRLLSSNSPRPTSPQPFVITNETDTKPVLQRHLPASATGYGYSVNSKTNASVPQTQFTVRAKTAVKPSYAKEIKGPNRPLILEASHNEYVRLVDTTKTMTFTNKKPSNTKATYYNPVLEYKTDQDNKRIVRVRGTGGGDKVVYEFGNTSQVADTIAFKCLLNALASEDGHLITSDLKDFFLTATLPEKVYLKILWSQLPEQTISKYDLTPNIDSNGVKFIYGELQQALYGLPQANSLAAQALKENLARHEFYETDISCLYRHKTRNITLLAHVDDFAIKLSKSPPTIIKDALFVKDVLEKCGYTGKFNWGGIDFANNTVPQVYDLAWCGYEIHHDKNKRAVTLSMNDYYQKLASQLPTHIKPCSTPGVPFNIKYGSKQQFAIDTPTDVKLSPEQLKFLQKFVGEVLWYSNAVAHDILTAISKLSAHQTTPTKDTFPFTVERIQGYLKKYGNHKIVFQASDMKLHIMSDASFDAEPKSRSRGGCFMWIGNNQPTLINGPVFCQSKLLPGVPQSAAAAEISQHVESGKMGIYARRILRCLGYPQSPTIILADNLCSIDFAHNNTKGRTLKTIARRTHWLKHVVRKNVYIFRYISSKNNIADIFTKLLDKAQHDYLCNLFLLRDNMLSLMKKPSDK